MGFSLDGFVLRAPRTAPSNALTTDEAVNGVERDFKPPATVSFAAGEVPTLVEAAADQYRAATLLRAEDPQTEYLLWAANTADLSTLESFETSEGTITALAGTLTVINLNVPNMFVPGQFEDGTLRFVVIDDANASVAGVVSFTILRGDTDDELHVVAADITFNPVTGIVQITDALLIQALDGGFSPDRGDRLRDLVYTRSAVRFWWSKNDRYETRFQWNGRVQRWEPLKGTSPRSLGKLLVDESYTLSPVPKVAVDQFLPGDSVNSDSYAMVRIGTRPDAGSTPVAEPVAGNGFGGIKVVAEDEVEDFDFSAEPMLAGVVGDASGTLVWNPDFITLFAGQEIFYSYRSFLTEGDPEALGKLETADTEPLFVAPIPGPTDYPFIRIGNRSPLEVVFTDTEALLAVTAVNEGQVGIALSTGRLKFNSADLAKANPDDPAFEVNYLGAEVFYDGLSLTRSPLPTKAPVRLVNGGGQPTTVGKDQRLYIPDAAPLPSLGVSGVLFVPDGTGAIPNPTIDPGIRPNGSGLRREVRGEWDLVVFTRRGRLTRIRVVDDPDEIPRFAFQIDRGTAYIDLNEGAGGSEVVLGREDLQRFDGEPLWFLQTGVQPAAYATDARMFSRVRDTFVLAGTEVFKFALQNTVYLWDASTDPGGVATSAGGDFTADEIATSLNAVITGQGSAVALNGRVVLQTDVISNGKHSGQIEIGWGPGTSKDLSGATALGFLPGWALRISNPALATDIHFLPDNGTHVGVFRSPLNLSGSKSDITDIGDRDRLEDFTLSEDIQQNPVVLLDRVPLEDQPGFDDGVFFRLQTGLASQNLDNYEEVLHQFGERKFSWVDERQQFSLIPQPATEFNLGATSVVPDSFRLPGKGLFLSPDGGPFVEQELNTDFTLPFDGTPGIARLITMIGESVGLGARGTFSAGGTTFTDNSPDVDFVALGVKEGYQLKITTGPAQGTYIVAADATMTNELEVSPAFLADSSGGESWELFVGVDEDTNDPGIIADVHYVQFNHLLEEPFKIRQLTDLGTTPENATAQTANRLKANISQALASNRPINLRFGQPNASPTATLKRLQQEFLGQIINSGLFVPDPAGERFVNGNFSIKVGTKTFTFANGDLLKVAALTEPLLGNLIEVRIADGLLNFGAEVFAELAQSDVYYVEEFADPDLSPTILPQGVAEYRIQDGALNLSAGDMAQFGGSETTYFVQQMVTENGQDVTISPLQGSILFNTPLDEFTIVEAEYFVAVVGSGELALDPETNLPIKVIEFVPLFVDREEATLPVIPPNSIVPADFGKRLDFNPTGRTVRQDVEPQIYVNNNLANVGGAISPVAAIDFDANQIVLQNPVDQDATVTITYAVNESFGGEQSYTVSMVPVYRPPFRIPSDSDQFVLEGDRTDDVVPGKLLRVGAFPFYVTNSTFNGTETTVEIFPSTAPNQEPGTLAPGNDILTLLSDRPIAEVYNPEAIDGVWMELDNEFEPINRGFLSVVFLGDLTGQAIAGFLLEIGGYPFIIAGSTLSEDGTKTTVDLTSATPTGFVSGQDTVRITIRPVYPPAPSSFLGLGPVNSDQDFEAVLFGATDDAGNLLPGRTLRLSTEYTLDFDSGAIEFLPPEKGPLRPGETLYLRQTRLRVVAPFVQDEVTITPRFLGRYVHGIAPSEENGILGQVLRAQYTFSSPDTWFYRTVPLVEWLAEAGAEVASEVAAQLPSRGAVVAVPPAVENDTQGNVGLKATIRDLEDKDRAARVFIEFYNETIAAFEQVQETISGNIVGDRDGKFRFFIGHDKEIPPPGYEDAITGLLNRRNIFAELWFAYNRSLVFLERDPLVEPNSAELQGDQIVGQLMDPDRLTDLRRQQREFIHNDVDDRVLVGKSRKRLRLNPFRLEMFGRYEIAGNANVFSRLFPERAVAFTLTDPGIQADLESDPVDPGVYAFRKKVSRLSFKGGIMLPKRASTFRKSIGDIGNPVLGQITGISGIEVTDRLARARVFAYSEIGFPDLDASFFLTPRPAVIATPLPLQDFPLTDEGLPDVTQLIANGGALPDLTTGDPDVLTPPFFTFDRGDNAFPQVAFGRPTGDIIDVVTNSSVDLAFGDETFTAPKRVFIGEILQGCILTFVDDSGDTITEGSAILEEGEEPDEASILLLERGDTIFLMPPDVDLEAADPPDNAEKAAQAQGLPSYRVGFDVVVDEGDGEYLDNSFPSIKDPSIFPIKEVFGQRPPKPLGYLEANVNFRNSLQEVAEIPALTGGFQNDDGDFTIPYLYATNTEIDRLGEAKAAFETIFATDSPVPNAVYPDEVQGTDGQVIGVLTGGDIPAALLTSLDTTPVTTAGAYTPGSGIGDVEPFDLLFVETPQTTIPAGARGIVNIGDASEGVIEPSRFVTPATVGARFRYEFLSMLTFVNQSPNANPPGMVISVAGATTTFDATSISPGFIVFNDGTAPPSPTGGLNDIIDPGGAFAYPTNNNIVRINIWTADDGVNPVTFVGSIELDMNGAGAPQAEAPFSGLGSQTITVQPSFDQQVVTLDTAAPFLSVGFGATDVPEDPLNPGFSRPLWFTIDVDTSSNAAVGGASFTGGIDTDRLTFREGIDLRSVLDRSTSAIDGEPVHGRLSVVFVAGRLGQEDITVNDPVSVNGGSAFTFLNREAVFPQIGTFDLGTGTGTVKVPAFEGHGNTPVLSTGDVVFSAIPSSAQDENGVIANGDATVSGAPADVDLLDRMHVTVAADVLGGDLNNVESGDLLVVRRGTDVSAEATTKAGTYLVKHAIQPDGAVPYGSFRLVTSTNPLNTGAGWLQVQFPTFVSLDTTNDEVTISTAQLENGTDAWPAAPSRIYFIVDEGDISQTISVEYTAVNFATGVFTYDDSTVEDADGNPLAESALEDIAEGVYVSGFFAAEVNMKAAGVGLPRSLVGDRTVAAFGFRDVTFKNPKLDPGDVGAVSFAFGGVNDIIEGGTPGADEIRIQAATPIANTAFVNDPDQIVYESVPENFLFDLSQANWDSIHQGAANNAGEVNCLFPGDQIITDDNAGQNGFLAQAGVFLEPSIPTPTFDLGGASPKVVDANNSLAAGDIGLRDATAFGMVEPERVFFEVRRIRRFHAPLSEAGDALQPLRFAYEIRSGVAVSFGPAAVPPTGDIWPYVLTAQGDGTNLGGFLSNDVNVNPGDTFRLLDTDGTLLEEVEIVGIVDDVTLQLAPPGITAVSAAAVNGKPFQVYLRQPPVPHQQSNEQLLDLLTDEVVLERTADYGIQQGGFVPVESNPLDPRRLKDTDSNINFAAEGVMEGDILIIDAAGEVNGPGGVPITGQERGVRPFGDRSVPNRTVATAGQEVPFVPGTPSELDDNRGFYRITEVVSDAIAVNAETEFSGPNGTSNVTFGSVMEYAVYPTVSGSTAPFADPPGGPGVEGQMDLRPTAFAGQNGSPADSYLGNLFSLAPLSYRIIRPSGLFSEEATDLILLMRERTLSFLEEFDVFFSGQKDGSYFVFQRDAHISDLGNPLIPDEGLGVMSNVLIQGVAGLTQISPFANTTDCLSVLDRRVWVADTRLDAERPEPADPTYTTLETNDGNPSAPVGDGRPVLPDLIDDVLDNNDQFRPLRLSWLNYRVNREDGVLFTIDIQAGRLARDRRRQVRQLRQAISVEDATS